MQVKPEDKTIEEIITEGREYRDDLKTVMEVIQEITSQLLKNEFSIDDIYIAMFDASIQMYFENQVDLEYGKQALQELYEISIESHFERRLMLDERTNPDDLDFFNSFLKEDASKIH